MTVDKVEYLRASYEGYLSKSTIKFEVNLKALLGVDALNSKTREEILVYFESLNGKSARHVKLSDSQLVRWILLATSKRNSNHT